MSKDNQTPQILFWSQDFGNNYTDRNPQSTEELDRLYLRDYGVSRSSMNNEFLEGLSRDLKILEVGSNIGLQLEVLRKMGFTRAEGVELNDYAVSQAKKIHPNVTVESGSVFNLPYADNYFDLVFTSGVLIHIDPKDLGEATYEIHRVSKKLIWGFEYFATEPMDIEYRGEKGFLWKRDFGAFYLESFSDLKLIKEKKFKMMGSENVSSMFLLEKK